jgi:glycosyltransferase involved in cell wall biosynthesis
MLSKARRLAGLPGDFFFFSEERLRRIAEDVRARARRDANLDFFHGFTPWILTEPSRPYVAWSDCTFADYIEHFHDRAAFREGDLARIEACEAAWLSRAGCVAFSSTWAADRAIARYSLNPGRVRTVGVFGDLEPPARDLYDGGKDFAFISTNFTRKGGHEVLAAFRTVHKIEPRARLLVVGDSHAAARREPGVICTGFLRKEDPRDYARLRSVFASSRAIINASRSDTAPVLLVEAGSFGCPVISTRRFAIPEIVEDGRTGLLLDDPVDTAAIAKAMVWMLEADEQYLAMRQAAWARSRTGFAKAEFDRRLVSAIMEVLGAAEPVAG